MADDPEMISRRLIEARREERAERDQYIARHAAQADRVAEAVEAAHRTAP